MKLEHYPRIRYTPYATPIEKLERLSVMLGGPDIYIKRDDLTGLAGGGNKARKLEFLIADALEAGADTIITCGAIQSNHCRLTAAAANKEGLACHLVLEERRKGSYDPKASGNNFLYHLLGATIHLVKDGASVPDNMQALAEQLEKEGRKPYLIPVGGTNVIGALGYIACVQEILEQVAEMGARIDQIVLTSGTGGTHAGVLTGLLAAKANITVNGISVAREETMLRETVYDLYADTARKLDIEAAPKQEDVIITDKYIGPGYALPSQGMIAAVKLLARCEGILLDPVYTGKTMAGMIDLIQKGCFEGSQEILFLHTGGSPGLYAYKDMFFEA